MTTLIKIGLLVAVAVIFPLMVGLGTEAFYPAPEPSEKCRSITEKYYPKEPTESEQAAMDKCYRDLEKETETYNRNVFIPITIVGFIAIAVGTLYFSEAMGPVAPGLVFGGLFTILYAAGRSFMAVDKRWLFLELLLVLVGLIFVTRRYLKVTLEKSKK